MTEKTRQVAVSTNKSKGMMLNICIRVSLNAIVNMAVLLSFVLFLFLHSDYARL